MISGIVLAAGSSQRMGSPKALLKIGERTFLQYIVDALRSARITGIVIVLGSGADEVRKSLGWFDGQIIVNEEWSKGQLSSIIKGLDAVTPGKTDAEHVSGSIICPVDHPLLTQSLLVDMLQGFWVTKKKIILPTYRGRRGHPVIFGKELFDEIRNASPDVGARAVIQNHKEEVYELPVEDEGILINIDSPEDYKKYIVDRKANEFNKIQ